MTTNKILLEGYVFELKGYCISNGKTAVIMGVKGDGSAASNLTGWVLDLGSPDTAKETGRDIISCEKRKGNGPWVAASAQDTTYELTGDIGVSGVLIEERISTDAEEPEVEFRVVFDDEVQCSAVKVAYISGDDVFCSEETLMPILPEKLWLGPIKNTFCLYLVVSDGYKPEGPCKANVSVTKRGAFLSHEKGTFKTGDENYSAVRMVKTDILGSVKIYASVPLKNCQACGDNVEACACDCFELRETVGYSNDEDRFEIKDICIRPVRSSFDLTLLNSYCGKSVYRLDGEYVIDCRNC